MKLARVFSDYMVLQRNKPILVWGSGGNGQRISVKVNGREVCSAEVSEGEFSFLIPALEAAEDILLEIGEISLKHVDIGEVWIAGGQSNMEFMLQYAQGGEEEIAAAADAHLRTYIVGQYSFPEEREEGYKAWNPWDRWLTFHPEHAAQLPAVAVYFAKELRKQGVPVGILSCNWGGTSASAWLDKESLLADEALKSYVDDFNALVEGLDLERYYAVKKAVRPAMASPESRKMMGIMMKNTFKPGDLEKMLMAEQKEDEPGSADNAAVFSGSDPTRLSVSDIMAVGPGDPNEPAALYENMLKEIIGYSVQGVIWYQGETDDKKPYLYEKLFSAMIACWRRDWKARNAAMDKLPFLFVQLAPFGIWRENSSAAYPIFRSQQERAAKKIPDVYMACISDIGNVYDIHPKEKRPVGQRLALLAKKYIYGMDVMADAPEAARLEVQGDRLEISFRNGKGLYRKEREFSSYNGFALSEIRDDLIPPVLDGINGLSVYADGERVENAACRIENERLVICSDRLKNTSRVCVEFARTGFYQVNLYNEAGIPAKPFLLTIEKGENAE